MAATFSGSLHTTTASSERTWAFSNEALGLSILQIDPVMYGFTVNGTKTSKGLRNKAVPNKTCAEK